jgi:hypothetical protein
MKGNAARIAIGVEPDDPRIGPSAKVGWEWVVDVHTGQVESLVRHRERDGAPE